MNFLIVFALSTVESYPRLLGKHVQTISKKLTAQILMFEVGRKVSSLVPSKDNRV
jgi:hypothetical protein